MSIKLENINKSFGKKHVLKDVSFEINENETCVILGPSGCGKTTLLEIISGLQSQDSGNILFDSKDISNTLPHQREVSMVFQNNALYPNMNVFENVEYPLKIKKIKKSIRKNKVEEMLKLVQMDTKHARSVNDLSGGEKKRVAIARSLVVNPKLFIMDEPLSSLDASLQSSTRKEIIRIKEETSTTLLYVTHDHNEARNIADTVVILNEGSVVQVGSYEELISSPKDIFVLKTFFQEGLNIVSCNKFNSIFNRNENCKTVAFNASTLKESSGGVSARVCHEEKYSYYNLVKIEILGEYFVFKSEKTYQENQTISIILDGKIYKFD